MTDPGGRAATILRRATLGLLALMMVGAFPATASAQLGVRRWLEKLSGPGPFTPTVIYIAPVCYGTKIPEEVRQKGRQTGTSSSRLSETIHRALAGQQPARGTQPSHGKEFPVPATRPRRPPKRLPPHTPGLGVMPAVPALEPQTGFHAAWECSAAYSAVPNWYFYYEFSWDNGAKSNLLYAPVGGETPSPSVGMQSHIVGATFSKWPFLEFGAGVGGFRFDPNFDNRDPFWRGALQPLRVNFRPLSFVNLDQNAWQALMVTVQSFVVLGTLTDSDFGALPGTYRESNEVVWTTTVTIDVLRLIAPKKASASAN